MLKRYKNELLAAVQRGGFNPSDFAPIETVMDGFPAFILRYKDTDLQFVIRNDTQDPHEFDYKYTPCFPGQKPKHSDYSPDGHFAEFEYVLDGFNRWLAEHVNEQIAEESVPDLWEALKAGAFPGVFLSEITRM